MFDQQQNVDFSSGLWLRAVVVWASVSSDPTFQMLGKSQGLVTLSCCVQPGGINFIYISIYLL